MMGVGGGLERPEAPSNNRCKRLVRGIQAAELKFSVFYRANKVSPTGKNRGAAAEPSQGWPSLPKIWEGLLESSNPEGIMAVSL